ncbi:glutaredoxin [Paraconexibacter antarcticus]|uniref:Glutaredoxin n=1 Tax=Paraconexibacter antarcticus TaxID=2949664 RepID=A0ABY5DU41_9ACTN|nr:glutaredoxin [Paraconexibacter antarcticus]UTI64337.1 glutaredoxin [Paraconexibacter antarcticus]
MPAAPVTVHVLSGCPHCTRALALLRRRGIEHDIVSGDGVHGFREQLRAQTGGWTVPQVVIGGRAIGGADQLARLDRLGVLTALVAGDALPIMRVRRRRLARTSGRWVADLYDAAGQRVARGTGRDRDEACTAVRGE